jgi:glycosyltransferase involved in cell wall biosynthesis
LIKLSIVVPCYNESNNIELILKRFNKVIDTDDIEVILVNNGSTDNSANILKKLLQEYVFARTVLVEVNQGYGFGVLSGLSEAKGEYIGWTHADMQTDPADVIKAFNIIEVKGNPVDIFIKGNRKGRSIFDQVFTIGMSFYETLYLKHCLWDINAQPNIFHKSFFSNWQNPPHDFSLDLYALYKAKKDKLKIVRFNVIFPERIHGKSSWNTGLKAKWKFIKRTVEFSKRLKKELK